MARKMMNKGLPMDTSNLLLTLPTFSLASLEWVKNSEVSTKASSTPRPSSRKYKLLFKLPQAARVKTVSQSLNFGGWLQSHQTLQSMHRKEIEVSSMFAQT